MRFYIFIVNRRADTSVSAKLPRHNRQKLESKTGFS